MTATPNTLSLGDLDIDALAAVSGGGETGWRQRHRDAVDFAKQQGMPMGAYLGAASGGIAGGLTGGPVGAAVGTTVGGALGAAAGAALGYGVYQGMSWYEGR